MILLYHKVDIQAQTAFWVSADRFYRQMSELQSYEVVALDNYDPKNPRHAVITFDGVYENVMKYAVPIMDHFDYPFELFVIGDYIGEGNEFDQAAEPPARFASVEQLQWAAENGGRIQWHSKSHQHMSGLAPAELNAELTVPAALKDRFGPEHFRWFAFPHGEHDDAVIDAVKSRYVGALSCIAGHDEDRYALNRITTKEVTTWERPTVAIIIPNYNYGQYLPEAIDSVLFQTIPADEILVIDDGSEDGSIEILEAYADKVRIEINAENLGIVENFRKAVSLTKSDYIAFVGADNRIRSDFVEKCRAALDKNENAAVAYTDLVLFGPRAQMMSDRDNIEEIGYSASERWPLLLRKYPEPTEDVLARFKKSNFVHGSSMYRRRDYEACGGYRDEGQAEDHNLFYRMHMLGRDLVHIAEPLLEYRQHSSKQANTVLGLENQNRLLRRKVKALQAERDAANKEKQKSNATSVSKTSASPSVRSTGSFDSSAQSASTLADHRPSPATRYLRQAKARLRGLKRKFLPAKLSDLEIAVVHYRQVRPTVAMLNAFFRHYPELSVTLVDNSGGVCSVKTEIMPHLKAYKDKIRLLVNPAKEHGAQGPLSHGGGIDYAIKNCKKPFLVSMETDSFVLERGGLEFLINLINQGYDWAGLGQKPYKGKFGSFSPAFAFFRVEPIRHHSLSFLRRDRASADVCRDNSLIKHHLYTAQRLREGKSTDFPAGKPPDTYRRPVKQIINAELQHLSYFDTGEWLHCALAQEGYRGKLFAPIDSVRHSWGSRDETIFEENFSYNLPDTNLNEFLPKALQRKMFRRCKLDCLTLCPPGGNGDKKKERLIWAPVGTKDVNVQPSDNGLIITIPGNSDHVYVGMEDKPFRKAPAKHVDAPLVPGSSYQLRCRIGQCDPGLDMQLWLIEYDGAGKRLKNHSSPVDSFESRLAFTASKDAASFRVFWRFAGQRMALIEDISLWRLE